jgi:hypothetical protein
MSRFDLSTSQALWNRDHLDLESDEVLAQILDRGELAAWRELYRLASGTGEESARLRRRILRLCRTVPLSFPHLHRGHGRSRRAYRALSGRAAACRRSRLSGRGESSGEHLATRGTPGTLVPRAPVRGTRHPTCSAGHLFVPSRPLP